MRAEGLKPTGAVVQNAKLRLEELPPVYLANGVRDVVVVDPERSVFTHYRLGHTRSIQRLPQLLLLECGSLVQLPA